MELISIEGWVLTSERNEKVFDWMSPAIPRKGDELHYFDRKFKVSAVVWKAIVVPPIVLLYLDEIKE